MVGMVALIKERNTFNSVGVSNFTIFDGNVEVSPHNNLRGRIEVFRKMRKASFGEHV